MSRQVQPGSLLPPGRPQLSCSLRTSNNGKTFLNTSILDTKSPTDGSPMQDRGESGLGSNALHALCTDTAVSQKSATADGHTQGARSSAAFSSPRLTRSARRCPDRWAASRAPGLPGWHGRGYVASFSNEHITGEELEELVPVHEQRLIIG